MLVFGGFSHIELGGDFADLGFSLISIGAGYRVQPEIVVGAELLNYIDGDSEQEIGLFAQYDGGATRAAIYVQKELNSGSDFYYGGLYAEFMPNPQLDLRAALEFSNYGAEWFQVGGDYKVDQFTVSAAFATDPNVDDFSVSTLGFGYQINDQIGVDVGFSCWDSGDGYLQSVHLGGSYELASGVDIEAYYGRTEVSDGPQLQTFGISRVFETGQRGIIHRDLMEKPYDDIRGGAPFLMVF